MLADGQVILATDLDQLTETARPNLRACSEKMPLGYNLNLLFQGATAAIYSTNPERLRATIIAPWDALIETIAVRTGELTAASTIGVTVTGPAPFTALPLVVAAQTAGANSTKLARLLYDGTKGRAGAAYMNTNRAVRPLVGGVAYTLQLAVTGNAAANSVVQVCLVLRQFFARGGQA